MTNPNPYTALAELAAAADRLSDAHGLHHTRTLMLDEAATYLQEAETAYSAAFTRFADAQRAASGPTRFAAAIADAATRVPTPDECPAAGIERPDTGWIADDVAMAVEATLDATEFDDEPLSMQEAVNLVSNLRSLLGDDRLNAALDVCRAF